MGVRIPANHLKEMDLELGDDIYMEYDSALKCLTLSKEEDILNKKFEQDVIRIIEKYQSKKEGSQ